MMKFLSLLLSATLIFTSLVPSYAEAASSISQQKARISAQVSDGIEHAVERARVRNGKFAVADKVAEVKGVVKLLQEGMELKGGQEGAGKRV